jgi:hypothetical protein
MVREVSGVNGQFITTWGSDLNGDMVIPGTDRPISTTLTCRCGAEVSFAGFPANAGRTSWVNVSGEYWCSFECAIQYEPIKMAKTLIVIRQRADVLARQAQVFEELLLNRK